MKHTIFIIILFFTGLNTNAQNPTVQWVKSNQAISGDISTKKIEIDSSGNIYIIGYFSGSVDFNPAPGIFYILNSSYPNYPSFIQKLNNNGNLVWVLKIDFVHGNFYTFKIDNAGNLIIAGNFKDSVDIDPGTGVHMLYSNGGYDTYILKLSANGNFIWAKSIGGPEDDVVSDLVVDDYGNIYSHGYYSDTVDFDPGPGTFYYTSGYIFNYPLNSSYILKLNKYGDFVWAKAFLNSEPGGETLASAIDKDSYGNIICAGYLSSPGIDFDPGSGIYPPPVNHSSLYLVKLDSSGSFIWARFNTHIGLWGESYVDYIKIDRYNNICLTGRFGGSVDFDPGPDTLLLSGYLSGNLWPFIQKFDENGNFLWAESYGSENSIDPISLAADTFGNIYSTGYFYDSTDLDPGPDTLIFYAQGGRATYLQKLNQNGDLIWAGVLSGNSGISYGWDILVDDMENVFVTGEFIGQIDFNPGPGVYNKTSVNNKRASYILKLGQCKILTTDSVIACDSLVWMDNITYYQSNNSAYFTLPSSTGCDSVICLSLNIPDIDTTVTVGNYGGSFTANQGNALYQWLDCNSGFAALTGDTLQTFTPAVNGSYAVAVNVSGCVDTSACVSVTNAGIDENHKNTVKLYPNPNTGKFVLDLGYMQAAEVSILNSLGQVIAKMQVTGSRSFFDPELKPGIYFARIRSDKTIGVIRFTVR
jgi:hypothetical protein